MASATSTMQSSLPNSVSESQPQNRSLSNRGRGSSRGDQRGPQQHNSSRGRGRGRGNRGTRANGPLQTQRFPQTETPTRPAPPRPPPDDLGGGGVSRSPPRDAAAIKGGSEVAEKATGQDGDFEAEVCFICASPVLHNAIAPCNHRTCHICALRLRALYKTRACAHCRVGLRSPQMSTC